MSQVFTPEGSYYDLMKQEPPERGEPDLVDYFNCSLARRLSIFTESYQEVNDDGEEFNNAGNWSALMDWSGH